jgi:hypothetical protein
MYRRKRAFPKLSFLVLWSVLGCSRQHNGHHSGTEPDHDPSVAEEDPVDGDEPPQPVDLKRLVHDVFTELQRDAELRCRCYVAAGDYPSEDACLDEVGRGHLGTECAERVLGEADNSALREQFECMLQLRQQTNACLENTSCDEQLTLCYDVGKECPTPDPFLLTYLGRECPGAIGLPR